MAQLCIAHQIIVKAGKQLTYRPRSWAKKGQATLALPSSKFHRAPRPTQGAPRPIISKPLIYIYLQPMYTRLFSRSHVSIKSIQFLYTMSKEPVSNSVFLHDRVKAWFFLCSEVAYEWSTVRTFSFIKISAGIRLLLCWIYDHYAVYCAFMYMQDYANVRRLVPWPKIPDDSCYSTNRQDESSVNLWSGNQTSCV